jgi:hypothetical protein
VGERRRRVSFGIIVNQSLLFPEWIRDSGNVHEQEASHAWRASLAAQMESGARSDSPRGSTAHAGICPTPPSNTPDGDEVPLLNSLPGTSGSICHSSTLEHIRIAGEFDGFVLNGISPPSTPVPVRNGNGTCGHLGWPERCREALRRERLMMRGLGGIIWNGCPTGHR